jgi:hypothetical protein
VTRSDKNFCVNILLISEMEKFEILMVFNSSLHKKEGERRRQGPLSVCGRMQIFFHTY